MKPYIVISPSRSDYVEFDGKQVFLSAGMSYVVPKNAFYEFCPWISWTNLEEDTRVWKHGSASLDGKRLLVRRVGGFGDILCLEPLISRIRADFPTVKIGILCLPRFKGIAELLSDFDVSFPVEMMFWRDHFDYYIDFTGVAEAIVDPNISMIEAFLMAAGYDGGSAPVIKDALSYKDAVALDVQSMGIKEHDVVVGMPLSSSSQLRDWGPRSLEKVIVGLVSLGCKVLLFGSKKDFNGVKISSPSVIGIQGIPMKKLLGMVQYVDLVITVDTFFVHLAGALSIPSIALYGPFSSRSRVRYYNNVIAFESDYACELKPCMIHGNSCPKSGPDGYSPCMLQIPPEAIVMKADEMLCNKLSHLYDVLYKPLEVDVNQLVKAKKAKEAR